MRLHNGDEDGINIGRVQIDHKITEHAYSWYNNDIKIIHPGLFL